MGWFSSDKPISRAEAQKAAKGIERTAEGEPKAAQRLRKQAAMRALNAKTRSELDRIIKEGEQEVGRSVAAYAKSVEQQLKARADADYQARVDWAQRQGRAGRL